MQRDDLKEALRKRIYEAVDDELEKILSNIKCECQCKRTDPSRIMQDLQTLPKKTSPLNNAEGHLNDCSAIRCLPKLMEKTDDTFNIDNSALLKSQLKSLPAEHQKVLREFLCKKEEWQKIKKMLKGWPSLRAAMGNALKGSDEETENIDPKYGSIFVDLFENQSQELTEATSPDAVNILADLANETQESVPNKRLKCEKTITPNADVNIQGPNHVRNCPCCSGFYKAISNDSFELEKRKSMSSRHRADDNIPNTLPGFWSIGFTQDTD